jgi:hypothetical protein
MNQSKQDVHADAQWSPWTPVAQLKRASPLFALSTDQTEEEVAGSLRHLERLGLMQVPRGSGGRQECRVRTDDAARARKN